MECLRTVTNLDDLHLELKNLGFTLSRSAKYLWFLPRRGNTSKGYGHLQTVPIKLTRPEINLSKRNKDRMFAKSFMDDLINVCKFFGPQSVLLLLNGNKEKVPLGLATASLQAPILMHREYKYPHCCTLGIYLLEFIVVNTIPLPHIHMHTIRVKQFT